MHESYEQRESAEGEKAFSRIEATTEAHAQTSVAREEGLDRSAAALEKQGISPERTEALRARGREAGARYRSNLSNLARAAVVAMALHAAPAHAEETPGSVSLSDDVVERVEPAFIPQSTEKLITLNDALQEPERAHAVVGGVLHLVEKSLAARTGRIKEEAHEFKTGKDKEGKRRSRISSGADLFLEVPSLVAGKAADLQSLIEEGRALREDIATAKKEKRSIGRPIASHLARFLVDANTAGFGTIAYDELKLWRALHAPPTPGQTPAAEAETVPQQELETQGTR